MEKFRLEYYCPICDSEFKTYISSEGVDYKHPNHCPVCGEKEFILIPYIPPMKKESDFK